MTAQALSKISFWNIFSFDFFRISFKDSALDFPVFKVLTHYLIQGNVKTSKIDVKLNLAKNFVCEVALKEKDPCEQRTKP